MKILTSNIRQGGGDRIDSILSALKSHNSNVIAITEFKDNKKWGKDQTIIT
jgi:hypothetical protein